MSGTRRACWSSPSARKLTEMLSTAQLARIGAAMMIAAHRGLLAAYDEEEEALVSEAYL
jgi:hypothetical protein